MRGALVEDSGCNVCLRGAPVEDSSGCVVPELGPVRWDTLHSDEGSTVSTRDYIEVSTKFSGIFKKY